MANSDIHARRETRSRITAWVGAFIALILAVAAPPAPAASLRWSGAGDLVHCDPHSVPDTASLVMLGHVYERLVHFDRDYQLAPALAERWERLAPTQMRFHLRLGVRFHDGTPFTADDVVFTIERMRKPGSQTKGNTLGIARLVRVDDNTLDVFTDKPLPTLLNQLALAPVMSRAWAVKHGATDPLDYAAGKEGYAARHANGTGPYKLVSFESGGKVAFVANPAWWGKPAGNVTEATYVPIKSNATRLAALVSGEVDLLVDPPIQDLERLSRNAALKTMRIEEPRVIFLSFDVARPELKYASVKGKNPFADRRVREAVQLSIDTALISQKVMRGHARPIGSMIAPGIGGYSARAAVPVKPDPARAMQLMKEAGYADGFSVTLDCTNDRYLLDEQLCAAVAGMLARIGVKAAPNPKPKAIFFQRMSPENRDTSLFIIGGFSVTADAHFLLESYLHSTMKLHGDFNTAGVRDAKLDALIEAAQVELDPTRRNQIIEDALMRNREQAYYLPLHQQLPSWAMRRQVETPPRLDSNLDLRWVQVR